TLTRVRTPSRSRHYQMVCQVEECFSHSRLTSPQVHIMPGLTNTRSHSAGCGLFSASSLCYNPTCGDTNRILIMAHHRILVSWRGHADLWAMADDQGEPQRARLIELAGFKDRYGENPGPLKTAVLQVQFDQIHLLSNYDRRLHDPFAKWL